MKEGIVLVCNSHFYPGMVATLNSLKLTNPQYPIFIFDTGLTSNEAKNIDNLPNVDRKRIDVNSKAVGTNFWQSEWMKDFSCFAQIFAAESGFDKILYLEVDMLILGSLSPIFEKISQDNVVGVMDGAIFTAEDASYLCPVSNLFTPIGMNNIKKVANIDNFKSMNGGLVGASIDIFEDMGGMWNEIMKHKKEFNLLAQSYVNLYLILKHIYFYNMGIKYNFGGLNNIYGKKYKGGSRYIDIHIEESDGLLKLYYREEEVVIPHYTREKPWLCEENNLFWDLWKFYYKGGTLL